MRLGRDNEQALVDTVVERIAEAVKPDQIILFGSRARGDATEDSDLDLLLVYDGPLTKRQVKMAVRRLFPRPSFSMDLFVLTPAEFSRQQKVVSTLGHAAIRQGIVCHG